MTEHEFRKLALRFAGAVESAHMGHPDFRRGGKIFATLAELGKNLGMVKLTQEQQASFVRSSPQTFRPCNGAWGKAGCTYVQLPAADKGLVKQAMQVAFENLEAPARRAKSPRTTSAAKGAKAKRAPAQTAADREITPREWSKRKARVIAYVASLPGAVAVDCGDGHVSLEAGKKKRFGYLLDNHHGDGRLAINCVAPPGVNRALVAQSPGRFHIPKYVGHRGWVGLWLDRAEFDAAEAESLLAEAYNLRNGNAGRETKPSAKRKNDAAKKTKPRGTRRLRRRS